MNLPIKIPMNPFLLVILLALVSCKQNQNNPGGQQQVTQVPVATVTEGEAVMMKEYSASIEGTSNIEIRPQVTGYLKHIFVDEGAYVTMGQPLFKIDDRVFQEQLNNAKALLVTAQANLMTSQISLNRKKELVKSKVVSDLQVQEAQEAYNAAKGATEQAASTVESARINLDFSLIKAPISGYIGRISSRLGSLLSPSNPQPVTLLSDIRNVYAYFSMSENDFLAFQHQYAGSSINEKLKSAPEVELMISNGEKYVHQGKIDAVEGQFNKNTGTITLRAQFPNPESLLRSGNTGKIMIKESRRGATLIPILSTMMIQDKVFVFTIDKQGKAAPIPLTTAGKSGDNVVVTNGIKPGEQYIASGFDRLQPGTLVAAQKGQNKNK